MDLKNEYINIRTKYSENITPSSEYRKKNLEIMPGIDFRKKLNSNIIPDQLSGSTTKKEKSFKFYKKFVNGIKKEGQKFVNNDNNNGESDNFINMVNNMMGQIMVKNKDMRRSFNMPKKKKNENNDNNDNNEYNEEQHYKRRSTINKNKKRERYIKNIIFIQRKFRIYMDKKKSYEELINNSNNYLSIQEIKDKTKEELEIELVKYIGRIKELLNLINYNINKINFIENNNKKLKNKIKKNSVLKIKKQENFNIIGKNPLTKKKTNEKDNKTILKNAYNNSTTNKRVTIIDIKDQNFILNIYKNENNKDIKNNIQTVKFEKNNYIIEDSNKEKIYNENIYYNYNDNIYTYYNENNQNENDNNNKIDNNNNKENNENNNENIEIKENPEEKEKRIKKSRGLRKLLAKKTQEKKEILKKYFNKFYLAGIYMSIRKRVKKKTLEARKSKNKAKSIERRATVIDYLGDKNLFNFSVREEESYDICIDKKKQLLTKIIYRKDRILNLIKKTTLQKLNLRAKLISLKLNKQDRKNYLKSKTKKKNKIKSKSVTSININNSFNNE